MPAITITDLSNAKRDVDHIAAIATSTAPTATDRLGGIKKTMAGVLSEYPNASGNAAAAAANAGVATTQAGISTTQAELATMAKAAAEAARDAALATGKVYATTAAGLAAVASGTYFSVPSPDSAEYLILYLNSAGAAVEQKRYPSAAGVNSVSASAKATDTSRGATTFQIGATGADASIATYVNAYGYKVPYDCVLSAFEVNLAAAGTGELHIYRSEGGAYTLKTIVPLAGLASGANTVQLTPLAITAGDAVLYLAKTGGYLRIISTGGFAAVGVTSAPGVVGQSAAVVTVTSRPSVQLTLTRYAAALTVNSATRALEMLSGQAVTTAVQAGDLTGATATGMPSIILCAPATADVGYIDSVSIVTNSAGDHAIQFFEPVGDGSYTLVKEVRRKGLIAGLEIIDLTD